MSSTEIMKRAGYKDGKAILHGRPKGVPNKRAKWCITCYNIETDEWEEIPEIFVTKEQVADRLGLKNVDEVNNLIRGRSKKYSNLYRVEKI